MTTGTVPAVITLKKGMNKLKVAIIGAGAMGSLYGYYLANAGYSVELVDIWQQHVDEINRNGLTIIDGNKHHNIFIPAIADPRLLKEMKDLIIVFVKSYQTAEAIESCLHLVNEQTRILTLQNGVGNVEILQQYIPSEQIMGGTTSHGANVKQPGQIIHAGKGKTVMGRIDGQNRTRERWLAEKFAKAGIEVEINDNIQTLLWDKLMVNVGINALTALLNIENGKLLEMEETQMLMKYLVAEAGNVSSQAKIQLTCQNPLEHVKSIAEATGDNKSSMLQDLIKGRRTEVDYINGAIIKKGKEVGVSTPYNKVMVALIKAKEKQVKREPF